MDEFNEISYVVEYAKLFHLDPDDVYLKDWETVMYITKYDLRLTEFNNRLEAIRKNDTPPG